MPPKRALRGGWYLNRPITLSGGVGQLYVAGRKKDLIIVGGRNIYPLDLETLGHGSAGRARRTGLSFWRL